MPATSHPQGQNKMIIMTTNFGDIEIETTRRAAKMVIVDADHPDIEEFINWKVKEEQKVASLVAGSKMHEKMLNDIFAAIRNWDGLEEDAYEANANLGLKKAIREAKKVSIPETYIKRVLDYARQGYASIEFPTYDTDWDSEAYASVSGQNSNNSIRVTDAFLEAIKDGKPWDLAAKIRVKPDLEIATANAPSIA